MAITYDAPSNTITVTGTYTDLHNDIWLADQAGGWGVITKQGEAHYLINNTQIQIGDGSTTTTCSDLSVNVLFETGLQYGYIVKDKATLTFGQQDSGYATSHGVNINFNSSYASIHRLFHGTSADTKLNLYSSSLKDTSTDSKWDTRYSQIAYFSTTSTNIVVYNCIFDKVTIGGYSKSDIYNLAVVRGLYGFASVSGIFDQVFLYDCRYEIGLAGNSLTVKNAKIITSSTSSKIRYTGGGNPHYLVNVDWSGANDWSFYWHSDDPTSIYRQYEFDAHCQDKDGNDLSGVSVVAEYISPYGQAFSVTTDANGDITTQTVDHGWFEQATGNTENLKTPLKVTYKKPGYQTVVKYYDLDEKTKDVVVMHKAVGVFLDFGKPVINLKKTDPENKNVMVVG